MKSSFVVVLGSFVAITAVTQAACTETKTDTSNPNNTTPPTTNPPTTNNDGGTPVVSKCTPATGPGTTHHTGSLAADSETWTANDSPHIIDYTLTIDANKTLTLEPCAIVRITKNQGLYVRGKLIAEGAADQTITIENAENDPWTVIEASSPTSEIRFVYTSIAGGGFANGGALDTFGMLDIRGNQDDPTQGRLHVDHVTLKSSASLGLLLREGGGISATSKDLTITGSASYPIATWARAAGSIPPTATLTGNKTDEILIEGAGVRDAIREDMTLANRGIPYHVKGSSLNVGAPTGTAKATLTIEPGVTLRFAKDSRLLMDASTSTDPANGVLKAIGTAAKPIVFTSAEAAPTAGDWVGLLFEATPDPNNKIDFARISYAGGDSGISSFDCPSPANPGFTNHGAIVIYGGKPAGAFVTNTTIENSAGDGIVRGWTGDQTDFLPSNTFTGVARCNQTFPKPTAGQCPSPAPCPKS